MGSELKLHQCWIKTGNRVCLYNLPNVPTNSSLFILTTTSTKSLAEIKPMAADCVIVLSTYISYKHNNILTCVQIQLNDVVNQVYLSDNHAECVNHTRVFIMWWSYLRREYVWNLEKSGGQRYWRLQIHLTLEQFTLID